MRKGKYEDLKEKYSLKILGLIFARSCCQEREFSIFPHNQSVSDKSIEMSYFCYLFSSAVIHSV